MLTQPLTNIVALKSLLYANGISPHRSMGQNFLLCDEVVEATITALERAPRYITELGSGAGTLTQALALAGYTVKAIEKDDNLVRIIPKSIPPKLRPRVTVVHEDLKEVPWAWEAPYSLVGNIPYNLSGLIFRTLVQTEPAPTIAVFLVQKEVGKRLLATPPSMNLLALTIQLWGAAQLLLNVPPNCFWPQPRISSQLLALTPNQNLDGDTREQVLGIAKKFFQSKRKQLGGMIKKEYLCDPSTVLPSLNIQSEQRPQELSAAQWVTLAKTLQGMRK